MSRKKLWAAFVALGCLGVAIGLGWADNNVLDHVTYKTNAPTGLKVDANGNLYTTESAPSANNYSYQPSVISAIFSNIPDGVVVAGLRTNRDSTSVIDCRGYNRGALLMFPSGTLTTDAGAGSCDSLFGAVFALEVRGFSGMIADSQSTFRLMPTRAGAGNGLGGVTDSVGSLSDIIRYSSHQVLQGPMRTAVLPSEKAVVVSATGGVGSDGIANGGYGDPKGIVVWSSKLGEGTSTVLPFMAFRLRCLRTYARNNAGNVVVTDSSTALPVRVRCDLILWRE